MARSLHDTLASLRDAATALAEAQDFFAATAAAAPVDTLPYRMARAGFIQHFEFTFELARNVIQRWLRENGPRPDEAVLPVTRREMFRQAATAGLIDDPVAWFAYADARNAAAHTYGEAIAADVAARADGFAAAVVILLSRLGHAGD